MLLHKLSNWSRATKCYNRRKNNVIHVMLTDLPKSHRPQRYQVWPWVSQNFMYLASPSLLLSKLFSSYPLWPYLTSFKIVTRATQSPAQYIPTLTAPNSAHLMRSRSKLVSFNTHLCCIALPHTLETKFQINLQIKSY